LRDNKKDKMQLLKEELYKMLETEPVASERVLALSEELDELINEYNPKRYIYVAS
jgi:hypothetical protein